MDEMDIDQVVDIPDTPDRLAARRFNGVQREKGSNSLAVGHSRNSDIVHEQYVNRLRAQNSLGSENWHNTRLYSHSGIKPIDLEEWEPRINSVYDNSCPSQNGPLFRKAATVNGLKPETRHAIGAHHLDKGKAVGAAHSKVPSKYPFFRDHDDFFNLIEENEHKQSETRLAIGAHHLDKGKAVHSKVTSTLPVNRERGDFLELIEEDDDKLFETRHALGAHQLDKGKAIRLKVPSKLPVHRERGDLFDLTKRDEHKQILDKTFQHSGSNGPCAENVAGGRILSNHITEQFGPEYSAKSGSSFKGKEKIDVNTYNSSHSAVNHGKGIDIFGGSEHKVENPLSASHLPAASPRVGGQKRLVRNGCISPHNIARRTQKLAESHQVGSSTAVNNLNRYEVSDSPSHEDIREIIAEDYSSNSTKGKGVIIHPSTLKKHDAKVFHVTTSSSAINNGAAKETRDVTRDVISNGWRRTHNHINKIDNPLCDVVDGHLLVKDDNGRNSTNQLNESAVMKRDNARGNVTKDVPDFEGHHAARTTSRHVSRFDQNLLSKRPKKRGLSSRNHAECSTMIHDDSEISFLGPSQESSSSRSTRIPNFQHEGILDPIYEIDELSPEMRNSNSQGSGNNDLVARARQVEADEMLARELQEQLYNESPIFGGEEIDVNLAWALQHGENVLPAASRQNHPGSRPRSSLTSHSNRPARPRTSVNPSNVRVPHTRMSQLRNRLLNRGSGALSRDRNRSRSVLSGGSNFHFPLDMDLDMRLDILEALEAAVGDFDDMSMTTSHLLQFQHDFNENDYEMLLALDENNHHNGASANQINGLPESVVQTDDFDETCAICLETPTLGESIRHLPCLHKFHKDCIDPWLTRKSSCPVCKSSVT